MYDTSYYRDQLEQMKRDRRSLQKNIKSLKADRREMVATNEALQDARKYTEEIAESINREVHKYLGEFVTRCLQAVFPKKGYLFYFRWKNKAGGGCAELVLRKGDIELDPMDSSGGGVVDVIAFALRLASILLESPAPKRIMILDEPFRFLSAEYRHRIRDLMDMLQQENGFQFVLVTHIKELENGNIVSLDK